MARLAEIPEVMVEKMAVAMAVNDSGPEGSKLFEIHWREFADGYRSGARAALSALPIGEMVEALRRYTSLGNGRCVIDAAHEARARALLSQFSPQKESDSG
jgi:hypothetical protein